MPSLHRQPHESLRAVVISYWQTCRDLSRDGGFVVTPDSFVDLVFFDAPVWVPGVAGTQALPNCVLIGPLDAPLRLMAGGRVKCVGVRMQSWVLGRLLHAPTDGQAWHDATSLFRPDVQRAIRTQSAGSWREVISELEPALSGLLLAPLSPDETLARSFVSRHASRVADISAACGISTRQAQRLVKAATHQSPKQLAGLKRFQSARDALWANPRQSLAFLAAESGYSDQAHLSRDFRRRAGVTPQQFAAAAKLAQS